MSSKTKILKKMSIKKFKILFILKIQPKIAVRQKADKLLYHLKKKIF